MSKIEWTHRPGTKSEVWNPTTGCDKISQGCKNCYAEVMHKRLRGMGQKKYQHKFLGELRMHDDELLRPLKWKKPRTVFVNSMSDLFHKDVTDEFLDKVFAVMVIFYKHTFQILTKRADRMAEYFSVGKEVLVERWANAAYDLDITDEQDDPDIAHCWVHNFCENQWPRPNIWLGVSAEDQEALNERAMPLLKTPASVHFISYEPALGPIDLNNVKGSAGSFFQILKPITGCGDSDRASISWVICGGESGHNARPAHPDWFRSVRDQCQAAGVKFFFKQFGNWHTSSVNMMTGQPVFKMYNSYQHFTQKDWVMKGQKCIDLNGKICNIGKDFQNAQYPVAIMTRVKKKDINVLDGVQHLEFPE